LADAAEMKNYYRQTFVLEKINEAKAIRYVCYEDLRTGLFCVVSGELLFAPETTETISFHAIKQSEQFIRDDLGKWFDSLFEAVEDFAVVMETERQS
jgi:hypothetical protein